MTTQIALLRGINVGRAKRIAMADLRAVATQLGFRDARTLLNSGNLLYSAGRVSAATAAARLEKAVAETLGVSSRVIVLTAEELRGVVADNPFAGEDFNPSRMLVAVLRRPELRKTLAPLAARDWGTSRLALGRRAAYVWCPDGMLESPLPDALGRVYGEQATTRNWATMLKLQAMADAMREA